MLRDTNGRRGVVMRTGGHNPFHFEQALESLNNTHGETSSLLVWIVGCGNGLINADSASSLLDQSIVAAAAPLAWFGQIHCHLVSRHASFSAEVRRMPVLCRVRNYCMRCLLKQGIVTQGRYKSLGLVARLLPGKIDHASRADETHQN